MARVIVVVLGAFLAATLLQMPVAGASPLPTLDGALENSAANPVDPNEVLVANGDAQAIQYVLPNGTVGTFVANVPAPGAIVSHADQVYFATGNQPGQSGTIEAVDATGAGRHVVASDLVAPNGIAFVGDTLFYTATLGPQQGIYRVQDGRGVLLTDGVPMPNGLTAGSDGQLYVGSMAPFASGVYRVDPETGVSSLVSGTLGPIDDLSFYSGQIYAASAIGEIYRINPAGGSAAIAASGSEYFGATSAKPALGGIVVTTMFGALNFISQQ